MKKSKSLPIVHVLFQGRPLCGAYPGLLPGAWPSGHYWTRIDTLYEATCPTCIRRAEAKPK